MRSGELLQYRVQIPGSGPVLQDKAGNPNSAVFPDVGVDRAVLPQGQIDLQVGQAGREVLEVDFRLCLAETVQGVQGVRAQVSSNLGDSLGRSSL